MSETNQMWGPGINKHGCVVNTVRHIYHVNGSDVNKSGVNVAINGGNGGSKVVPEYRIRIIVTKALGDIAPSIIRRQMERLDMDLRKGGVPLDQFDDFIGAMDEATKFLCSRSVRAKMLKELRELSKRYG